MRNSEYEIKFSGKETLSYREGALGCLMNCFYVPESRTWTVVIQNEAFVDDERKLFDQVKILQIEGRVRKHLSVRRFFGFPIGKCNVVFLPGQALSV